MARGWESKSVESQQSESVTQGKQKVSNEESARRAKREGLELSRGRIVRELETARSEVHRTALKNALSYLDDEIAKL